MNKPLIQRFGSKVCEQEDGCWEWMGATNGGGYGIMNIDGMTRGAHRVAYELFIGPLEKGKHLHHVCRNRKCVNPLHLEPLSPAEHIEADGTGITVAYAKRTHCAKGHEFTPENTITRENGGRRCRICINERILAHYHKMTPEEKAKRNEVRNARRAGLPREIRDLSKEKLEMLREHFRSEGA